MFYLDLFAKLARSRVRYVVVGGLALNLHGVERATMDVDLTVALHARISAPPSTYSLAERWRALRSILSTWLIRKRARVGDAGDAAVVQADRLRRPLNLNS